MLTTCRLLEKYAYKFANALSRLEVFKENKRRFFSFIYSITKELLNFPLNCLLEDFGKQKNYSVVALRGEQI